MGRPKYSKGGYIKKLGNKKYFDSGGIISNAAGALGMNAGYANTTPGTSAGQLNTAYTNATNAANQQVGLQNTLIPQAATAANNQNTVAAQELAMTEGQGPNPAQNQLATATGTNVSNEAALLAGQRGAGANPGMAGRNIATAGTQAQEGAAGQAATLQAQQQIAAQGALSNLSNQQVAQAQGATTALNTAEQNEQNILQNANTSQNNANVSMQGNVNNVNAQTNQSVMGGITSGGGVLSSILNKGGEVQQGVHPDKKHKLEFIHKMTKLGMEHFDEGGQAGYTSSEATSGPSIAAPAAPAPSGGSGGGGGGGGIMKLAALAYKGGVMENYAGGGPAPSPTPTQSSITFGAPSANASEVHPQGQSQPAMQNVMSGFRQMKADGGPIQANPLLANMPIAAANSLEQPGYTASSATSGPSLGGPSGSGVDLGKAAKSGYDAGQKLSSKTPDQSKMNADASEGSTAVKPGADPNDPSTWNKGGEIWNIHPSQHAEYAATHFSNYFSKGGESKDVPAMVSPGERYWNPEEVERIKHGYDPMKLGKIFPGKDKVPGKDSLKNDTLPATLQEGGIVNPLHIEKTKNPDKARLFILKSLKATGKHLKRPAGMK